MIRIRSGRAEHRGVAVTRHLTGRRPAARDAGTYSVEAILTVTLVLTVVLGTFQVALWAAARSAARHAANGAVIAATLEGGTEADATQAARARLERGSRGLFDNHDVDVSIAGDEARATVSGDVLSLVPGFPVHVTVTSTGSIERWTNP